MMMMYNDKKKKGYNGVVRMPKMQNMEYDGEGMQDDALSSALYAFKMALSENDTATAKKAFKTAVSLCAHCELADDYGNSEEKGY